MSKLCSSIDENNPSHMFVKELNEQNEKLYGPYHDECGLFQEFCRCFIKKENE
jgi:hypothetical protein